MVKSSMRQIGQEHCAKPMLGVFADRRVHPKAQKFLPFPKLELYFAPQAAGGAAIQCMCCESRFAEVKSRVDLEARFVAGHRKVWVVTNGVGEPRQAKKKNGQRLGTDTGVDRGRGIEIQRGTKPRPEVSKPVESKLMTI